MSGRDASHCRRPLALALALALVVLLAACGGSDAPEPAAEDAAREDPATTPSSAAEPATPPCAPAPLEVRAATVLVVGLGTATTAEHPLSAQVASLGLGGVVLVKPNVVDATQVRTLVDGLRRQSPRPLLVSVDEEGGRVSRLRPIIGTTPSARELGRRPPAEISAVAAERGATLRDLGFDLVLAPVVDVDGGPAVGAIGDRSFATTPAEAGARAAAFAEGLSRAGVLPTAKHFPGQGEVADSHDGAVVADVTLGELEATAAATFGPVIEGGVPAVMMSHVTFPALGTLPTSLEPAAYRLLRSLGFEGVAVTDAVNMSAVADQRSLTEATVMALAAGADLVLATPGDQAAAMRDAVVAAVADGRLPEARLDEAVARVLALRGEEPSTMVCG
ncbi:MAG TPA: glycoside hydrolase family 3 N-terminal domain-containing protein [Acidimicrobiales bacterium]|nr:glycoside hydrolase family 3 N-terminal domain-containing protein [Acidimicrobiales bacterium]